MAGQRSSEAPHLGRIARFREYLLSYGEFPGEPTDRRGRRRIVVGAIWFSFPSLFFAVGNAWTNGRGVAIAYVLMMLVHLGAVLALRPFPDLFHPLVRLVFATDIVVAVIASVLAGGLYASALGVLWALIAVLGSLIVFSLREAVYWFFAFLAAILITVVSPNFIDAPYTWPSPEAFSTWNIFGSTTLVFIVMAYFVMQRDRFQRLSDDLLHNMLPNDIAERLKGGEARIADEHDAVTVLFADVVDFTPMSAGMAADEVVGILDDVFTDIDALVRELGVEKIKTVGDEYMIVAGVPVARIDHAQVAAELALRIVETVASREYSGHRLHIRVGLNSGPAVAGVIGREKFAYDLWGPTVNTASRMQSHGIPDSIQVSAATHELIKDDFHCERRGMIDVKGLGQVETWLLRSRKPNGA